jgi:hypothetical protein
MHYWLVGWVDGQQFLIYGGPTEEEARRKGLDTLAGIDFEIRGFRTRHLPTASSFLKGNTLDRTGDIRAATKRLRHKNLRSQRRPIQGGM